MANSEDADYEQSVSDFTYILVVAAVLIHVIIIAIISYMVCCRHKCVCQININNTTIRQDSRRGSETGSQTQEEFNIECSTQESLVVDLPEGGVTANEIRPVTNWNISMLSRVRNYISQNTDPLRLPPPYTASRDPETEGITVDINNDTVIYSNIGIDLTNTGVGFTNVGADFSEENDLPSYQEYVRQSSFLYLNDETGQLEEEKPPLYDEVA